MRRGQTQKQPTGHGYFLCLAIKQIIYSQSQTYQEQGVLFGKMQHIRKEEEGQIVLLKL